MKTATVLSPIRYKQCYMIKYFFSAALLLFCFISTAQFIDESKQWNVRQEIQFGPTNTAIFKVYGDTLINGLLYKTIWVNEDSTSNTWYNSGFLREDSNRVYFREFDQEEGLLYDFNLQAGDTTYVISIQCWEPVERIVLNVDSIEIFGITRTRWHFDYTEWDIWIEGIGSLFGPLNSIFPCWTDWYVDLLCYYENDTLCFINENFDECYLTLVGIYDINKMSNIKISPNPSQKGSLIKITSSDLIRDLEILSLNGMVIKYYQNLNSKSITINRNSLLPGMYLLKVRDDNSKIQVLKMVLL